ncbi:unnamed protein product, partial [marine sediment metagenome]
VEMKNGMLAAVFEGEGKLILKEVPIPVIEKNNDVLIKVEDPRNCDLLKLQQPAP